MAMVQRRSAFNNMLNEMFSLIPILRRENQRNAREYLSNCWEKIVTVTSSLDSKYSSEFLERTFKGYIESEEDTVRRNLADVRFKIDEVDSVYLVTGEGGIEKVNMRIGFLLGDSEATFRVSLHWLKFSSRDISRSFIWRARR